MLGTLDFFSDAIRSIYKKYKEEPLESLCDFEVLANYRLVAQALTHAIDDDAKVMAKELDVLLTDEISYRMNRWRIQADQAANDIRDRLMGYV
jgi:hypothetical protein